MTAVATVPKRVFASNQNVMELAKKIPNTNEFPFSSSCYNEENAFEMRRSKSSSLLFGHSRDFKNVETFNLCPGYRLTRSAGKVYVSIQTKDPPPIPKPVPREALLNDLRDQVTLLSTYLEEERLRHAGTKKRAVLDIATQEKRLQELKDQEILQINLSHEEEKKITNATHAAKIKQLESQLEEKLDKMHTEYRMLQASFKIYQSTVQDEMQEEMKIRRAELEWEKKQSVETAVDDCRRKMEDNFSRERDELRREFKRNMHEMMKEHQLELEKSSEKSKFDQNIEDLMRRSQQLTVVEEENEKITSELKESEINRKMLATELDETKRKLSNLELQFDGKVRAVEEEHRSYIDSLKQQKADVTRRLVRSCEELQVEKLARETAEKYRQEAAIITLEKKLLALNSGQYQSESDTAGLASKDSMDQEQRANELKMQKHAKASRALVSGEHDAEIVHLQEVTHEQTDKVLHLVDDITTILSGVTSGSLPRVLSGMLVNLTESETKRRMPAHLQSLYDVSSSSSQQASKKSSSQQFDKTGESATEATGKRRQSKRGSRSRFSQNQPLDENRLSQDASRGEIVNSDLLKSTSSTIKPKAPNAYLEDKVVPQHTTLHPGNGFAMADSSTDRNQLQGATTLTAEQSTHEVGAGVSFASSNQDSTTGSSYSRIPFYSRGEYSDSAKLGEEFHHTDTLRDTNLFTEAATQTLIKYKNVDFSSDESFNRKPKQIGLSKAATQPAIKQNSIPADILGSGRWRGTFLGRDTHGRPPIIFEVEEYKALTTTKPDSSALAKKFPIHSSKTSAENVSRSATPSHTTKSSVSPKPKR